MSGKKLSPRPTSAKSGKVSKNKTTKTARAPSRAPLQTHRIMTRARSKQFKFFDLPAELRNRIYSYALEEPDPLPLKNIRIPPLIHASQQIRSEAVGLLTSLNTAKVAVRYNYCVRGRHVSGTRHFYFKETGILSIATARKEWMLQHAAVFKGLEIDIGCSCCEEPLIIATLSILHSNGRFSVRMSMKTPSQMHARLKVPLKRIEDMVWGVIEEIKLREKFVGFGYEDLRELVGCLRISMIKESVVLDA